MKKYLNILIVLIIVIAIIIGIKFFYAQKYTLEEATSLINPKISNNMYAKISFNSSENTLLEFYVKDNIFYEKFFVNNTLNQEFLYDTNLKKQTNIFHYSKEYNVYENDSSIDNLIMGILSSESNLLKDETAKKTYEYIGKETVHGIECIKFSIVLQDMFVNIPGKVKIVYYLSPENKCLEQVEIYTISDNNTELYGTYTYIYSYDIVTDEDILKFDTNDYPDYTYSEN